MKFFWAIRSESSPSDVMHTIHLSFADVQAGPRGGLTDWKILVPRLEDDWNAGMPNWEYDWILEYFIGWYIGWYIGWFYWNDILDMVWWRMYVQLGPQEDPPEKCGLETLVKSRRSGRVTLAGYEDINQEWSPIFFRHTWSYSHKPVLFGSFSCVIERC